MKDVIKILSEAGFGDVSPELIKSGHNKTIYLLAQADQQYVVSIGKTDQDGNSSLKRAYYIQSFLWAEGVRWIAEPLFYDSDHDLLVERRVGSEDLPIPQMSEAQLDAIVQQLAILHKFTAEQVNQFFISQNQTALPVIAAEMDIEIYGTQRFLRASKTCPDQAVLDWISQHLEESKAWAKKQTELPGILHQGDIGNNFRRKVQEIYHINWEFAGLGNGHELSYIKIHSHPTPEQFDFICDRYLEYSGLDRSFLLDEIKAEERVIRVNDVIWAAMKWGEAIEGGIQMDKYRQLTLDRIDLYNQFCGSDN